MFPGAFTSCCCFCSVDKSWLALCDPMNYSTPGFSVHHYFLEFDQTHVHWLSDTIQPSHSLSPPSSLALSIFPSTRVFSNESALHIRWPKYWSVSFILPVNIQGWFPLGLTSLISLQSKGLTRVFSSTTAWKHKFFGAQPSLWSNSHIHTLNWKNHSFDYMDLCQQSDVSAC